MLASINTWTDFLSFSFLHHCPVLCCVCVCQAFIKLPKEGVSFPRTRCQLFPISPAPWKTLQEPLSLCGMGAAEVQAVCENGVPVSQAWIQSALCKPPMGTQRNRLGSAYTLSLSHRFILTQEKKSGKKRKKVTSAVLLAANVECTALGIFWEQEPLWMENRGGEESLQSSSGLLADAGPVQRIRT